MVLENQHQRPLFEHHKKLQTYPQINIPKRQVIIIGTSLD